MANTSIIFGLETAYYDSVAPPDAGKEVILATPWLEVFSSASHAIAKKEGINIVEGDLSFFAFDGSPLKACFSKEPYVDTERREYFPGIYSLVLGLEGSLQDAISKILINNPSPHANIVVRLSDTDESAREYGWSDVKTMREDVEQALKILPPDMAMRIVFESLPLKAAALSVEAFRRVEN